MAYSIKDIPRDDYAVQSLRTQNTRPAVTPETGQTPEYPDIHTDDRVKPVREKLGKERRNSDDRRSGDDRRENGDEVMFDTRSGRERRRIFSDRRDDGPQPENITHKLGVDLKA